MSAPTPTPPQSTPKPSSAFTFKPRGNRRPQAEREALARAEAQRQKQAAAEEARIRRLAREGRGGILRTRGRGGARGRGGSYADRDGGAPAPILEGEGGLGQFAPRPVEAANRSRQRLYEYGSAGVGSSRSGTLGTRKGKAKEVGDADDKQTMIRKDDDGDMIIDRIAGRERKAKKRMNTDMLAVIEISSDEEEEANAVRSQRPKGLLRREHKERQVDVITSAEVKAAEEPTTVDSDESSDDLFQHDGDAAMKDDMKVWPGAARPRNIKTEAKDEPEAVDPNLILDKGKAKDANRKEVAEVEMLSGMMHKPMLQDEEDIMYAKKLHRQRNLFTPQTPEATEAHTAESIKEGDVCLFQFPPLMPPLQPINITTTIKSEPNDDVIMSTNDTSPIDLTKDTTPAPKPTSHAQPQAGTSTAAILSRLSLQDASLTQPGYAGRLIIRRSGKMEIDYGGMLFEIEAGIPVDFARTAVLTTMDELKPEEKEKKSRKGESVGTAYGMGSIREKFVAVPKWSEEREWVVEKDELPPNGIGPG